MEHLAYLNTACDAVILDNKVARMVRRMLARQDSARDCSSFFAGRKTGASLQEESEWMAMAMKEQQIRTALEQHWSASAAGDLETEHEIYHEKATCDDPQSGERIYGRENLKSLRGHHPGRPSGFTVRRISGSGNLWVTEYLIDYEGKPVYTVSMMEFEKGKCRHARAAFFMP